MTRLLDTRELAAETLFARDEELRFLARRHAVKALGVWAVEAMAMHGEVAAHYTEQLVDAFTSGTAEDRLLLQVQTDLERAGKPALSTTAVIFHAQALAQAIETLRGRVAPRAQPDAAVHRYATSDGSLGWRE